MLEMSMYSSPGPSTWTSSSRKVPPRQSLTPTVNIFISRDDGSLVPVIPVDRLPQGVQLSGVPQRLTVAQTKGMINAGCYPTTEQPFSLASTHTVKQLEPQPEYSSSASAIPTQPRTFNSAEQSFSQRRIHNHNELAQHKPAPIPQPKLTASTTVSTKETKPPTQPRSYYNKRPLPPSGVEPDPKKKEFCSHWIQHGSCSFAQQGCRYKHEMPNMEILREKFGYQKTPAWWRREQNRKRVDVKPRDRSSSEWEEVERQFPEKSTAHNRGPPVRFSTSRPSSNKATTPKSIHGPDAKKDTPMQQAPVSPLGGVRLTKIPNHHPVTTTSLQPTPTKKPSQVQPPEFDLIDFDDEESSSLDISDTCSSNPASKVV